MQQAHPLRLEHDVSQIKEKVLTGALLLIIGMAFSVLCLLSLILMPLFLIFPLRMEKRVG